MCHGKMCVCETVRKIVFSSKTFSLKSLSLQKLLLENSCSQSRTTVVLIIWPTGQPQGIFWNDRTLDIQVTFWQPERKLKQRQMETYLPVGFPLKLASVPFNSTRLGSLPCTFSVISFKGVQRNQETCNVSLQQSTLTSAFGLLVIEQRYCK